MLYTKTLFIARAYSGYLARKKKRLMTASYLFPVLVPLVGLVFPALAMATLFLFIEGDEVV